jgi:poly(3-hydroxybutyrate) depolymerase
LDTIWAILRFRHWLPRWSIPIAFADEDSFLVTFPWGDRQDQVWLKYWCHDVPDDDADPEHDCFFVANSVPALVTMLHKDSNADHGVDY